MGGSIGGGVGRIQGLHGLIADNLLSAQVVTAAGNLITVSETENSDLLWALRGAGVDFAIVLEATYRIYDHTNNGEVFNVDLVFPASANKTHFEILKTFETNMPAELSFLSNINYKGERGGVRIYSNCLYQIIINHLIAQYPIQCRLLRFRSRGHQAPSTLHRQ